MPKITKMKNSARTQKETYFTYTNKNDPGDSTLGYLINGGDWNKRGGWKKS